MGRQHEQSLIDGFLEWLRKIALKRNKKCITPSLDGQDREVCADYLITDSMVFILVEFKYQERNIATEKTKSLSKILCKELLKNVEMKKIHQLCHFIAWGKGFREKIIVLFNTYFNEVCNKKIFENCFYNLPPQPLINERFNQNRFADCLFLSKFGVRYEKFQKYVDWLLQLKKKWARWE